MNNPKMFQLQFKMNFGEISCELNALIKPTEHPRKFHVMRVQFINPRENTSVINDFYIVKVIKDRAPVWVHAESEISSLIVQAIGNALDQHNTPAWL